MAEVRAGKILVKILKEAGIKFDIGNSWRPFVASVECPG